MVDPSSVTHDDPNISAKTSISNPFGVNGETPGHLGIDFNSIDPFNMEHKNKTCVRI